MFAMVAQRKLTVEAGQRFNHGIVIDPEIRTGISRAKPNGVRGARLRCDCGTEYEAPLSQLTSGRIHSCGCKRRAWATELAHKYGHLGQSAGAAASVSHGLTGNPLYRTWTMMMRRCGNPEDNRWDRYGGRGIKVCDRWRDVCLFIEDIERDLGPRPKGMTLDRKNNDGDYEPGNVRWATQLQQARNKTWAPRPDQPALGELRTWGPVVSLPKASLALGVSNTQGHRLAQSGRYPVPLIGAEPPYQARTADLIEFREKGGT